MHHPVKPAYSRLNAKAEIEDYYTYADLQHRVEAISHALEAREGSILLLFQSSFDFLPYFLACLHKGVTPSTQEIPNSSYKMERLVSKLQKYNVAMVVVQREILHNKWFIKLLDQLPEPLRMLFVEAPKPRDSPAAEAPVFTQSSVAFIQFTSGTTRTARALGITHANLSYAIASLSQRIHRNADTISINWLPHYHDLGLIDGLLAGLYWGSSGYLMNGNDFIANPLMWLVAISRYGITHSSAPNFAYDLCVDRFASKPIDSLDLSSIRSLLLGGEMVRARTLQRFSEQFSPYGLDDQLLLPGYGMAEATLAVSCQGPAPLHAKFSTHNNYEVVNCGAVFEGTQVEIVDDTGKVVEDRGIGSIKLAGKGVAQHLKDGAFVPTEHIITGDIGYMADGQLYLLGREGDLMIKNGQNYALSEIEEIVAAAHAGIHTSGVVALLTQSGGSSENFEVIAELKRKIWTQDDCLAISKAIRMALSRSLGLFPDSITLLGYWNIPRTSSGKKQKKRLKDELVKSGIRPIFESNYISNNGV